MGEIKNLDRQEGIKKIKQIADEASICMMCTNLGKVPFETRPMGHQEIDEDGNMWFFSGMESYKNEEIMNDHRVQLIYSCPEKAHFMSVYGHAKIIKDREKTDELWNVFVKTWFQEGKDDPSLTLIKFQPEDAYYWDTKHGKIVSLVKIAVSAVIGKTMDDGVEGNISI
jgi:general stress protein 26